MKDEALRMFCAFNQNPLRQLRCWLPHLHGGGWRFNFTQRENFHTPRRRAPFMIPRKKTWWITTHHFSGGPILRSSQGSERRCPEPSFSGLDRSVRAAFRLRQVQPVFSPGRRADRALRPGRLLQLSLRGKAVPPLPLNLEGRRRMRSIGGAVKTACRT